MEAAAMEAAATLERATAAPDRIGKYQVLRKLGEGATSEVFLCHDEFAGRDVAVKIVYQERLNDPQGGKLYRKLFVTEASLAGKLAHPHIAQIYDAVVGEKMSYIVVEYVPGGTLEQFCVPENLLALDKIVEIVFKCTRALDFAHKLGVTHRDIKPANILLVGGTDIKITDFGSAIMSTGDTTQVTGVGSPAYMSPQQIKEQSLTHQTDIYSLGVVIYKMLTGRLPLEASNNYSLIYQILNVSPRPPSEYRPEIPLALDAIVLRMLKKELADRYRTWDEVAQDLVQVFGSIDATLSVISDTEKFDTVRGLNFFRNFSDVQLWEVLHITRWRHFEAGTLIVREGETGDSFYILAGGEVKVTKGGRLLTLLKAGDCFGELAYLARGRQFKRTADVVAVGDDVITIEVNSEMLARASDDMRHQFNGAFLEILVDRLAMANMHLSALLAERHVTIY